MEESGNNLAEDHGDIVSSGATTPQAELKKRRSTRIVQAVPLLVTGVDALGRPFQERTSSLIINCHGCRYQSKHYVLKNMWVTLEVPHQEDGHLPRSVRGRVAWIQRPRTVRQLFQVAVELELPGNVWGIAFPPDDWFTFPDEAAEALERPAGEQAVLPEGEAPVSPAIAEEGHPEDAPDNLRVFPAPTETDASMQLARQLARLLSEAKPQIQAVTQEAARHAVSEQVRASLEEWQERMGVSREEFSQEVARAVESLRHEVASQTRVSQGTATEAMQRQLSAWLGPQLEKLTEQLGERLRVETAAQRSEQERHSESARVVLQEAIRRAEESAQTLHATASQGESLLAARAESAMRTLEEFARKSGQGVSETEEAFARAAEEARRQIADSIAVAEASWQRRLVTSLETGQAQLQQAIEGALDAAAQQGTASVRGPDPLAGRSRPAECGDGAECRGDSARGGNPAQRTARGRGRKRAPARGIGCRRGRSGAAGRGAFNAACGCAAAGAGRVSGARSGVSGGAA
jgi:exonuclease VII small subunit